MSSETLVESVAVDNNDENYTGLSSEQASLQVLKELDVLGLAVLPSKNTNNAASSDDGHSPPPFPPTSTSPTVETLMFGDLSSAFSNLDARDLSSP
eukprot:CAMPEP_0197564588 /NCGR_PEP_ID=MMETSP1320-20131121/30660_1 /TAXON_ID=91990 /ORGANISM="Bolidomonas sp., Strain RCC2347" /LENGTH=95 /DNA_ID=CAMNT_0043126507 /DNA_START=283 /DNA_END=567 /DNA_ORIENTATION=-